MLEFVFNLAYMRPGEFSVINSPISPFNDIIMETTCEMLIDVIPNTEISEPDLNEIQLYLTDEVNQLVFQTIGQQNLPLPYLIDAVAWYAEKYLGYVDIEISLLPD